MKERNYQNFFELLHSTLIDTVNHYLANTPPKFWQISGVIIAGIAAISALATAVIMFVTTKRTLKQMKDQMEILKSQTRESNESFLSDRWDQIFAECVEHPELLDAALIESLYDLDNPYRNQGNISTSELQMRYSAFCYRLWNLVGEMVKRGFSDETRFRALTNWAKELHGEWLIRNPVFFTDPDFWKAVNQAQKNPHMIVRYKELRRKTIIPEPTSPTPNTSIQEPSAMTNTEKQVDDIDWGFIAPRYFAYILSPCHKDMIRIDQANNESRNPIGLRLKKKYDDLNREGRKMRIVEFGCGPGTLVDVLEVNGITEIEQIVFVDRNQEMLDYAKIRISNSKIISCLEPAFHKGNMSKFQVPYNNESNTGFDAVICINSVLSTDRAEVVSTFKNFRRHKNGTGDIFLILPSFDTTEYLENLWYAKAREEMKDPEHAKRLRIAFQKNKRKKSAGACQAFSDQVFADDGHILQGYHTKQSIKSEVTEAGLDITEMREIFYPWHLCQRFDYGNFEGSVEILSKYKSDLEYKFWDLSTQLHEEIWDWFVRAR